MLNRWAKIGSGVLLLLAGGCAGAFEARREFEVKGEWRNYRELVVQSSNGSLDVSVHPGSEFAARGTITARGDTLDEAQRNVQRVEVVAAPDRQDAGVLRVRLECPDALRSKDVGASIRLSIPGACRAQLETSNGSVTAAGLKENVTAATSNGRVALRDIGGQVTVRTSNGAIELDRIAGAVRARTSNGRVELTAIDGDCDVETSNGGVRGEALRGSLTAASTNGSIDVQVAPPLDGRVLLVTSNGSIRASLPANLQTRVDLRTSNGRVRHSFPPDAVRVLESSDTRFVGVLNGGERGRLEARTSNGSIALASRPAD